MSRLFSWIKTHKLTTVLLLVVGWFMFGSFIRNITGMSVNRMPMYESSYDSVRAPMGSSQKMTLSMPNVGFSNEAPPTTNVADRMVVRNSHMSLKVKDVSSTLSQITKYAESIGGYMVDSSVTNPEDSASGTITIRIPETSFDESLDYFRSLSVKVVSENLTGRDVTDQYQDIEERLRILEGNKGRFEEIMQSSSEISDIVNVQERIFTIQNQIDSLKGQQQLLVQTAKLSKVTLYLATDELSLPYAPEQAWRPQVVFQKAVRSLLTNMQSIGSIVIWIVVYSIIWVPLLLIFIYVKKRRRRSTSNNTLQN